MAEAAGLVIGAVSIASLFTTCVDCFEYVQLGRNFGKNYQRSLLRLDVVKLRLSRWADAVNKSQTGSEPPRYSTGEALKVQEILGEIIELFANAEKISARYMAKAAAGDELVPYGTDGQLEPDFLSMHKRMQELALKRQKRSSFVQKAAWVLYEEKYFRRLIEDLTSLVDALDQLFPAAQPSQQQLSAEEAEDVREERHILALEEAADGVDKLLQISLQQVISRQSSHTFTNNTALEHARVRYGDEDAGGRATAGSGHHYYGNTALGNSRVHYGNKFGGRSVLDD
ncbi:hypothetical protein DV737_g5651, partial [Chaetothyriales sp. CBS 132003]